MADSIYRVVVKFQAEGKEQLESAIPLLERLQEQGAKVGIKVGEGTRKASFGMNNLIRSGLRVGFMLNMVESAFMRQTMAQLMATNAQERYNTVVARYGRHSEEARKAARQMEGQMKYLNLANNRANISMGLLIAQMALQTGVFEKERLVVIKNTAAKYGHIIATKLENVSLKELVGIKALNSIATKLQTGILKGATAVKAKLVLVTQAESAAHKSSVVSIIAHKIATAAASIVDIAHTAVLKAKAIALAMSSPVGLAFVLAAGAIAGAAVATYVGSKQEGGYIRETGLYMLHTGEYVVPKAQVSNTSTIASSTAFNFETHLHLETDLDTALAEQNRRIRNAYRSEVG